MRRLNDLFGARPVHAGELLSVGVFEHLPILRERARSLIERDHKLLDAFLDAHPNLVAVRTRWGTTSFIRLRKGDTQTFVKRLRAEFETSVVPGRFFGMPDYFRIGMGAEGDVFGRGLKRIGQALAEPTAAD
jgi:aspartate/methionine/tyrosine aminotransferase